MRSLVIALVLGSSVAVAQTKDKEAVTFDEVERGFYVGAGAGPFFLFNPPAAEGTARDFSPGQAGVVEVGFDFGDFFSVGVFVQGSASRTNNNFVGYSGGAWRGDFSALVPGALARVNLFGFADAQQTRRTFIYLRAGAGYALFAPRQLLPDPDILVFGGPGVEYYTRLRHFSIGVELSGNFLVRSGAFGVSVLPNLRYAF